MRTFISTPIEGQTYNSASFALLNGLQTQFTGIVCIGIASVSV